MVKGEKESRGKKEKEVNRKEMKRKYEIKTSEQTQGGDNNGT